MAFDKFVNAELIFADEIMSQKFIIEIKTFTCGPFRAVFYFTTTQCFPLSTPIESQAPASHPIWENESKRKSSHHREHRAPCKHIQIDPENGCNPLFVNFRSWFRQTKWLSQDARALCNLAYCVLDEDIPLIGITPHKQHLFIANEWEYCADADPIF